MKDFNEKRTRVIHTILLTYSIPPVFVILLCYLCGIVDESMIVKVTTTWSLYAFVLPLLLGVPYFMNKKLKKLEKIIANQEYDKLKGIRTKLIWIFIMAATLYSSVSIPVCYLNGFTRMECILCFFIALAYVLAGNVPFILRFTAQLDSIFAGIPREFITNSSLKFKTLLMNVNLSFGGAMAMITSAYSLMWRMENFPELGYTLDFILVQLVLVGLFIVAFQIIPGTVVTSSYSRHLKKINKFANAMSHKNLTDNLHISSRDEFGDIARDLNSLRSNFKKVLDILKFNATHLQNSSNELSALSGVLSETSSTQAANAEEIAASVEETSANIASASDNAAQSVDMSKNTSSSVKEGHDLISRTQENVTLITEKIATIQELADQTNLLAINAFIEAANAGEQGKGFAVVAREIRVLADRSKISAEEISELATQCVNYSRASFEKSHEMIDYISKTAEMANVVNNSSKEQHLSIEQINYTVQDFNKSSQTLAASSEELAATSGALVESAETLDKVLNEFKID